MTDKPRVWKAGHDCWAVTTSYYCQELDEAMHTIGLFRTWGEAIRYATNKENQ